MIAFLNRHKVFLLFLAIVVSQLLTWRAVVAVHDDMASWEYIMLQKTCGGDPAETGNHPCHVVVDKPNSVPTIPLIPDASLFSK
jgi:hypothetical protein